jgi:hypothetical protein
MPVTYRIDRVHQIIYTRCVGQVTVEEVLAHFRELEQDPKCPPHLDVLLDLARQVTIPKRENLQEVAIAIWRVQHRVQFGVCAIVARTLALYGMLRMFEVLAARYFGETSVFRTKKAAQAWLASRRNAAPAAEPPAIPVPVAAGYKAAGGGQHRR